VQQGEPLPEQTARGFRWSAGWLNVSLKKRYPAGAAFSETIVSPGMCSSAALMSPIPWLWAAVPAGVSVTAVITATSAVKHFSQCLRMNPPRLTIPSFGIFTEPRMVSNGCVWTHCSSGVPPRRDLV
jgi:hypothetical protein